MMLHLVSKQKYVVNLPRRNTGLFLSLLKIFSSKAAIKGMTYDRESFVPIFIPIFQVLMKNSKTLFLTKRSI